MENHIENGRYKYAYTRVKQIIDDAESPIGEALVRKVLIACMEEEDLEEVAILLMIEKGLPEDMFDYCVDKVMRPWWGKSHIVNLLERMKRENLFDKLLDRTHSFFWRRSLAQRYQSLPEEVVLFSVWPGIEYSIDREQTEYDAFHGAYGYDGKVFQTTVRKDDILYIQDDRVFINPDGRDIRLLTTLPTEYYFNYLRDHPYKLAEERITSLDSLDSIEESIYTRVVQRAKKAKVSTDGTISEIIDRIICEGYSL